MNKAKNNSGYKPTYEIEGLIELKKILQKGSIVRNVIVFVTHNKGKIASASRQLEGVNFKVFEYDLEEPRSDHIKFISRYKVMEAYRLVNKPCISLDC